MKVLVNALSVTNQSGRHVLMGHLEQIRKWTEGTHEYLILHHQQNQDMITEAAGFHWLPCPAKTSKWYHRSIWEYRHLNRIASEHRCDFLFTPAGVTVPGLRTPQVVFCQNPWCLVPALHKKLSDRLKAWVQRRAYRRTMADAELMIFNSQFMHDAYQQNAGFAPKKSLVAYQAISDSTWSAAERLGKSLMEKGHIVCVSAMGDHKGAEYLVQALAIVRENGIDAKLTFAGGWPDPNYRKRIEDLVEQCDLENAVTFSGWITDRQLHELYSRAHVFCLLSRCESFGIPAVEAQSFATPALGTDTCAIPEIGGKGGLYSRVDDPESAANNMTAVLSDDDLWSQLSQNALDNAQKYRWEQCSRPLLNMFELVGRTS